MKLLQELDGIITNEHHWILEWTAPYQRVVYWNKFGQPKGMLTPHRRLPRHPLALVVRSRTRRRSSTRPCTNTSIQLGEGAKRRQVLARVRSKLEVEQGVPVAQ